MSRILCLLGFFLATIPMALSQQAQSSPQTPEDAFSTRELIAWSGLQKPQPAPQPLPPRDTPLPQPDQSTDQPKSPADPQQQESPAQSFTGKILKDGSEYVLKSAGNTTYRLDEQQNAGQYENQSVKVTGTLDRATNSIHVVRIELLS